MIVKNLSEQQKSQVMDSLSQMNASDLIGLAFSAAVMAISRIDSGDQVEKIMVAATKEFVLAIDAEVANDHGI